ncbi:MAG: fumarate hydratase C-terminal domain-containing protein, partial [Alphaproteobacteria bacterium]
MATGPNKIRLSTNPTDAAIAALQIGDIVYLDGTIYTAREGVYMRVIEDGVDLPLDLPAVSAANFHCSPAATQHEDGSFALGAVTATASFRFSKWIGRWFAASGAKLIIGKGGMSPEDYRDHFVPNGAIYLT